MYHRIETEGSLYKLLTDWLEAYRERTKLWSNESALQAINELSRKVNEFMATQEERLQGIATKIDEVLSDLAALKANNPQIEDEISAIEAKLSITQPEPTTESPSPEG